jgi:NodT family efflux transporter outer membrane factor (OMF) lipoprotein
MAGWLVSTTACVTVGPDFVQPELPANEQWLEAGAEHFRPRPDAVIDWWRVFDDPVLEQLVALAHERNNGLKIAGLRVLEAQAQLGIATGGRFPQVQAVSGQALAIGSSDSDESIIGGVDFQKYSLGVGVSWEIDFWGRFERGIESADAALLASIAGYDEVFVLLTAGVAELYALIRTVEEQLAVTAENLANQTRSYEIVKVQFDNGETSELDVIQARTLLLSTQAAVPELEAALRRAHNALSTLLGMPPSDLGDLLKAGTLPAAPGEILVGVPAETLRQRPDVRRAEMLARAQNAAVGLAQANLYPSFSIGGALGLSSTTLLGGDGLASILDAGSLSYSVGPSFVWPFLNYGRIKNSVRVQDARLQQALANYRETAIQAAREVEDAMVSYSNALIQGEILEQSVAAATRATELSMLRYREGLADYQRVLTAQQALFAQQSRYVSNRGETLSSLIAVYRALGGGWQSRGESLVDDDTRQIMNERTDWGELLENPVGGPDKNHD